MSRQSGEIPISSTPILDRISPMPDPQGMSMSRIWAELILAVSVVIPFLWRPPFISYFLRWAGKSFQALVVDPDWAGVRILLTGFAVAILCLLAIAIHECGHVLAGLAVGFRCNGVRFGRVLIDRRFRISRHTDSGDAVLGWAEMVPQSWEHIRPRTVFMLAGGPLASLSSGYVIYQILQHQTLISGAFVGVSFFLGLANWLPIGMQGHLTDGTQIWLLLFNQSRSKRSLALMKLRQDMDSGVPLQSLSSVDLQQATSLRDGSAETVQAHLLAYLSALSRNDPHADQMLEMALEYSRFTGPSMRELLAIQAAHFQAVKRNRVDLAEQWISIVPATTPFLKMRSDAEKTFEKLKNRQS